MPVYRLPHPPSCRCDGFGILPCSKGRCSGRDCFGALGLDPMPTQEEGGPEPCDEEWWADEYHREHVLKNGPQLWEEENLTPELWAQIQALKEIHGL